MFWLFCHNVQHCAQEPSSIYAAFCEQKSCRSFVCHPLGVLDWHLPSCGVSHNITPHTDTCMQPYMQVMLHTRVLPTTGPPGGPYSLTDKWDYCCNLIARLIHAAVRWLLGAFFVCTDTVRRSNHTNRQFKAHVSSKHSTCHTPQVLPTINHASMQSSVYLV